MLHSKKRPLPNHCCFVSFSQKNLPLVIYYKQQAECLAAPLFVIYYPHPLIMMHSLIVMHPIVVVPHFPLLQKVLDRNICNILAKETPYSMANAREAVTFL